MLINSLLSKPTDIIIPINYIYWRIYVTANGGNTYTGFGEITFYQAAPGASIIGVFAKDVLDHTSWGADKAIDGNPSTACLSQANSIPWWFGVSFNANTIVTGVSFSGNVSTRWPVAYILQKSNDGINWVNA